MRNHQDCFWLTTASFYIRRAHLKDVEGMEDLLQEQGDVGGDAHVDEVFPVQLEQVHDELAPQPICMQQSSIHNY